MKRIPLFLFTALVVASPLRAALLFSEDFDNLANGTAITTSNTALTILRVLPDSGITLGSYVNAVNPSLVGDGAAGQIFATTNLTGAVVMEAMGADVGSGIQVGTLAFTFYYSGTLGSGSINSLTISSGTGSYYTSSNNAIYTNTQATFGIRIDSAGVSNNVSGTSFNNVLTSTVPTSDTAYNMVIVFNKSSNPVTYDNNSETLAAGTGDLWMNGTLIANNFTLRGAVDTSAFAFKVTGFTDNTNTVTFDNIAFYNSATFPVPEPSIWTLTIAGLIGIAALRRSGTNSAV